MSVFANKYRKKKGEKEVHEQHFEMDMKYICEIHHFQYENILIEILKNVNISE